MEDIKQFLRDKPGYLREGGKRLQKVLFKKGFDFTVEQCKTAIYEVNQEFKTRDNVFKTGLYAQDIINAPKLKYVQPDIFLNAFEHKTRFHKEVISRTKFNKNVLVIGDLHEPFCLDGYLEHCLKTYKEYKCDEVVFIGDIIDNHASSYHESDPDGHSAGEELKLAIARIHQWYKAFPKATVIIGNHDRIIMRKAHSSGLSKMWVKDYAEVLGVPEWNFTESIEIDDVLYIHGEGGTARNRVKSDLQSIVQGHLHTQCYTEWYVGAKFKIFGMQVGCGVDHKSYAMAYAKENKKPAIACGVVLKGKTPINIMMEL